MLRRYSLTALLTGSLMFGLLPLASVHQAVARATGVVAVVTAVDTRTGTATLTTEAGEVYTLPKATLWNTGTRVQCERVEDAAYLQLRNCQLW